MFAHRGFLYKRAHWIRANPLLPQPSSLSEGNQNDSPSNSPSTPVPSPPLEPASILIPEKSSPPTSATSPAPASSDTPSLPTLATSTPPSSASSSLSSSSNSPPSSTLIASVSTSSTHPISSAVSTPLTLASTPTIQAATVAIRPSTSHSISLTSTPSPSTTSSTTTSSGTNSGAIVGGIAGTLAGIAALGFLLMWCMRRQRSRDIDDFDAKAFKRQSAILVDDPVEPPRSYNPRPPTMIERHNASPALAAQAGQGSQNFYGNYGGYDQQPFAPEMIQHAGSPHPQAYGAIPMSHAGYNDSQQQVPGQPGYTSYDPQQQQLARQPSNATYLTRQASFAAGYAPPAAPPSSFDPNAHYVDLGHSGVSPRQTVQHADTLQQMGPTNPDGQHTNVSELSEEPLPSPFDDPTPVPNTTAPYVYPNHPSDVAVPPVSAATAPQTQRNTAEAHQRPTTVYDEDDAYGGI